ncbi:hypothetical protein AB834_01435 [PVC group bacterium (ex Bugula neritina AB1)]|nr:hypothetical protein AB834_01435 [PVC group bacterium (ex Bugula neritina AB1)]
MIQKNLNLGLLILRLGLGVLFIFHGFPKIIAGPASWLSLGGAMSSLGINFLPTFWGFLAASSEFFGGIFLVLGLFHRTACAFIFLTMSVALLKHINADDSFSVYSHCLTCAIFALGLFFTGSSYENFSRSFNKSSKTMRTGKVKRVLRNKGFGFITDMDGKQIFFHQTAVVGTRFESLKDGQEVSFHVKHTPKGPNAINVRLQD